MRIGLVTCCILPEPDPDEACLADGLRARGHVPVDVPWDGEDAADPSVGVLVLRSPWNYCERPCDFLRWVQRAAAGTVMINGPEVVRWNMHKGYLLRLAAAGVPIVPTALVRRGDRGGDQLRAAFDRYGRVVLKPAIGAGSLNARWFGPESQADAMAWLERLAGAGDVLVQPYLDAFRDPGERSLIWIDGQWTHAIRKHPRFEGDVERVEHDKAPSRSEVAVAIRALSAAPDTVHYARVDLVVDNRGRPLLSELELIEPSLYLEHEPRALWRFIDTIERAGGGHGARGGAHGTFPNGARAASSDAAGLRQRGGPAVTHGRVRL